MKSYLIPKSGGYDFVEFYNRSNKIFDANKLYIANRNSSGVISSTRLISTIPYYIFPGDYIVVTEDADQSCIELFGTKSRCSVCRFIIAIFS